MAEDISSRVAWKLRKVIQGGQKESQTRTGTARVQRRDPDGTVWVRLPGASIDTPVTGAVVANVAAGDLISYDMQGGRVSITGNASDPSAGKRAVSNVRKAAESAFKVASGARAIADAIGQHFFTDDNGVHVSSEKRNPTGERNILMNSLGILLRQGSSWLASFSDSAVAFYDGLGNAASNILAQFGIDGAVIGRSGESRMELDYHSIRIVDRDDNAYMQVSDLRNEQGYYDQTRIVVFGNSSTPKTTWTVTVSDCDAIYSVVDASTGESYTFSATASDSDIILTVTTSTAATTGPRTRVSCHGSLVNGLPYAYTLGYRLPSSTVGIMSYAEGYRTVSSGFGAHAEGGYHNGTAALNGGTASGDASHAEGVSTVASGVSSHAEGYYSNASGRYSHAQNYRTVAGSDSQTAIGKYNDNDPDNAFEIGNGTSNSARSNAFAVGWNGDLTYQGTLHGATWQTGTSGTTSGGTTTLPSSGTYILVTGHNSTAALNGLWIVRTGSNAAFNLAGGGNVTVSVSGTTLTVTTTAGTVNVYYQLCGT